MKILQVHNQYVWRGGEESVLDDERSVLLKKGHEVIRFTKDSREISKSGIIDKIRVMFDLKYSKQTARQLSTIIKEVQPDICHVHNIIPLVTPAVYQVCHENNVPVVQTLHNFRLVCSAGTMFRDGDTCDLCVGRSEFPSIKYKCYRDSYWQSALLANMKAHHRRLGTWRDQVDLYLCFSEFARDKFIKGGLPGEKLKIKPNFVTASAIDPEEGDFFLYVGRIEQAKGVEDIFYVAAGMPETTFCFVGDVDIKVPDLPNIKLIGKRDRKSTLSWMAKCKALIFPSKMYEGMPMTILEAFSLKKPVIARDHGVMAEMIDERNGLKFDSIQGLRNCIEQLDTDVRSVDRLGENAYQTYIGRYSEERGYENLMKVYEIVL